MALDVTKFKSGQNLVCTVEKLPLSSDKRDTIERLMRLDPTNKRALRRAQRMRKQRLVTYNRGNRDWVSREKSARVVRAERGASFTLPYAAQLANDLAAVGAYLKIASK